MPVFGGYETVAQLSPTPFGSVYKARAAGGTAATFIIKTFSPLGVDERELRKHPDVKRFLGSAELQKLVAASNAKHWAPIHDMGISEDGAYYVSTFYPTSASRLIKGKTKLDADDLFALTEAVLAGLVELRECCRRSHGNLLASAILLPRMDASGYAEAMLAEPLAADSTKPASEQGDLAALGRVLYELVMHKAYNVAGAWPIPDTPEWGRMGKRGRGWRELCNKLLSTDPADALTLEAAQAELAKLKPKKAPVPIWAVAAAVLLLAIGAGTVIWMRMRPDPHFSQKWEQYCDAYNGWFRMFGDPEWRRTLDDSYYRDLIKAAEGHQLKPNEINQEVGSGMGGDKPPPTREGRVLTSEAIAVATQVQAALLKKMNNQPAKAPLDGESVRDGLANYINDKITKYSSRQWKGPAEVLRTELDDFKAIDPKDSAARATNLKKLRDLFDLLPQLEKIESEWAQIETRAKPVIASGDPILKNLGALLSRRLEVSGRSAILDLGTKIEELNRDLKGEQWVSFFTFFDKDWKNDIERDAPTLQALRGSDLYVQFTKDNPPLEMFHLQTWMQEAASYTALPESQNPSKDPKLAQDLTDLRAQLSRLVLQAAQAGTKEKELVDRLDLSVKALADRLAELGREPYRKRTQERIANGVSGVQTRLGELQIDANRLADDLRLKTVANAQELIMSIERASFPGPLMAKWNELRLQKWGWGDMAKLRKDLEDNERRATLKRISDAAAKALREVETSLPDRIDLSATGNRSWGPALSNVFGAMEKGSRLKSMEAEARLIDFDRLASAAPLARPQHKQYTDWREAVEKFVGVLSELEDRMDGGYGLSLGVGEKTAPVDDLLAVCRASPVWNDEVRVAIKPVLDRFLELQKLQKESETAKLVALARDSSDPAMAIDAWRRLGQMDSWPRTPQELEIERSARRHIPEVIKYRKRFSRSADKFAADRLVELDKEITGQGPARWLKFMVARRTAAELEKALSLGISAPVGADFGVPDWRKAQLPAEVRWNLFLLENKGRILNLPEKMEDPKAQEQVKQLIAFLPGSDPADPRVRELEGLLKKLADDQGGAAPVADVGPLSPEAQKLIEIPWDKEENGNVLTFTWRGRGHQLKFVRLEGATLADGSKAPPYYLSTTEMTLALFSEIMSSLGDAGKADALGLPLSGDGQRGLSGPQLWRRNAGGGIEPGAFWLKSHPAAFEDYAPGLGNGRDLGPHPKAQDRQARDSMPIQYVPPNAALFIAAQLGCRFPTYSEWNFAARAQPNNTEPWPNLRDATWAKQFAHIARIRPDAGSQAQYADNGMFKPVGTSPPTGDKATAWAAAALQAAGLGGVPGNFNDGYLWLRPVGAVNGFSDLYGNVAEVVFDDAEGFQKSPDKSLAGIRKYLADNSGKLFVVGGSCISAPELGVDRQLIKPDAGYADMGFRLAFVAANQAIVDRLKDVMKKQQYVVYAGSTTAPAN